VFADGGACFEKAHRQAIQAAVGGNDRGPRAAGTHHAVDSVASEIKECEE
jgi:hypothetical protein